jgi:hypothetical protein
MTDILRWSAAQEKSQAGFLAASGDARADQAA